ncbi:MAG: IclR family transcriptional regulator [Bacteroidota bacterium]
MERYERYAVPAIQRAVQVLEVLATSQKDATLSELCKITKVPKSSLFRILITLEAEKMVHQDHERKKFSLGTKLLELGSAKLGQIDLSTTARPFLERLARETQECVYLGVLDHGQVILLQHIDNRDMWKIVTRLGDTSPAHCTAIGQVLLAGLPEDEVSRIASEKGLKRYTKKTITSEARLQKRLEEVRSNGYAIVDGEYKSDLCAVAAPIRDHTRNVAAAVMFALPSSRADKKTVVPKLARALERVGVEISRHLGYIED